MIRTDDRFVGRFILVGQSPVPCPDLLEWARWFEKSDRHVADWHFGPVRVSTVFLGLDHNIARFYNSNAEPVLFETMMFILGASVTCDRCSTWTEAEAMHRRALLYLRSMWRRPLELAGWIHAGLEWWMRMWDCEFGLRYGKDTLLQSITGGGEEF